MDKIKTARNCSQTSVQYLHQHLQKGAFNLTSDFKRDFSQDSLAHVQNHSPTPLIFFYAISEERFYNQLGT